jgi:hypothetical protein
MIVELTVAITPKATTTRLKLCCVVRTAFSPGERSDHLTCPVSPVSVMPFRCGAGEGLGVEPCVACTFCDAEKALRPSAALRVEDGCMRGSKKDGRRSAIASEGLYIAAMVALVNSVAREERWRCGGGVVHHAMMQAKAEAAAGRPSVNVAAPTSS